ncbi:hypothetical protein Slin14017_G122130 [Septoria linicola]|nr:hypothetical protein Slin14017_G122130 [Septoria linicola]
MTVVQIGKARLKAYGPETKYDDGSLEEIWDIWARTIRLQIDLVHSSVAYARIVHPQRRVRLFMPW